MSNLLEKKQNWAWWFLLPLYPYKRRRTLIRELIPDQLWSFEQLQGLFYVAVPIRMTVIKIDKGLMIYNPIAPTIQVIEILYQLEEKYGAILTIVLPTTSGLEHKLPLPALARSFPMAEIWVSPGQWSFPLQIPLGWLGIPPKRTRTLLEQKTPHGDQLSWYSLGPLDLGVGRFQEIACFHKSSSALLLTDSLISFGIEPPEIFNDDPTPLLFHAREYGDELLIDSLENRRKGWARMVLFASYLRPERLKVRPVPQALFHSFRAGLRHPHTHFGLYPLAWYPDWYKSFELLMTDDSKGSRLQIAPVLERLVFPRSKAILIEWMKQLEKIEGLSVLVPAHYNAPIPCCTQDIIELREGTASRNWASNQENWFFLASLDRRLLNLGFLPSQSII
uniref:DUF4336 domain-containing protein n=1 Tax=Paulinella chromatophora TaxID=39717 RepID=B1X5P9_PAUCH|nr:hypothetical protein PCC_0858 [Paulinella chromatophora]ACB43268.1 hypothetical protein PCC_0858 [Paulinella chromatophora]